MELRTYQRDCHRALSESIEEGYNPIAMLATGTGKSLIIAELAQSVIDRGGTVWVLTHIMQLVSQNAEAYAEHTGHEPGIICSGLNRRDLNRPVIFATIQSIIRPAREGQLTLPHLIIVDEAHRVPHKTGEAALFEKLFALCCLATRVGLTATPWRMDGGLIYGEDPKQFWFNHLAYKYTVTQAVSDGWLSPITGVMTDVQLDLNDVTIAGDYVQTEVNELENVKWLESVARSMVYLCAKRRFIAVYCPGVTAAMRAMVAIHSATGYSCELVTGEHSADDRKAMFARWTSGDTRVLLSVDVLTTGFNFPALDCIVCLRPTLSSALWVQICGRGTRKAQGKTNCLLLDYVGNLQRLGGVDMMESYVREKAGEATETVLAEPTPLKMKKPRRQFPGVTSLVAIDPMTGEPARDDTVLTLRVVWFNCVALDTRRGVMLMCQYTCLTAENARVDATLFVDTQRPNTATERFVTQRGLALTMPVTPSRTIWVVKNAPRPHHVLARKQGRYWNVTQELFA